MAGFLGRWLSDALRLGLSLAMALAAMQLPAIAHEYSAALRQVAEDARRDIDQREDSARRFYPGVGGTDEAVIEALRPVEPSNAQALRTSVDRARALRDAHDRVEAAPPLLRPVVAVLEVAGDGQGDERAVMRTALDTHAPQVLLGGDAVIYGLLGLVLGAFLAEVVASMAGALFGRRRGRRYAA